MKKVLIIDDEELARRSLKYRLPREEYDVFEAGDLDEAYGVLNSQPSVDIVIVDLRIEHGGEEGEGPETGLDPVGPSVVRRLSTRPRELSPAPIVIALTACPSIASCKRAMRDGAYDYLDKNEPEVYGRLMDSIQQGLAERTIPGQYEDRRWLEGHFDEVAAKYRGKRIAIHREMVIAAADTIEELDRALRRDFPQTKPFLVYVPEEAVRQQGG